MRELLVLTQEPGQLDIGIHPVLQLAVELEEKPVVEKHRRVALFGVEHLGGRRFVVRLLRQQAAPQPDELPTAALEDGTARHQLEDFLPKFRIPDGVVEDSLVADSGDHSLRRCPRESFRGRPGFELHGHRVNVGCPVGVSDLQEPQLPGVLRHRDLFDDPHLANASRFRAEPAAGAQIARQNLALKPCAMIVMQERRQVGLGLDHGRDALFRRAFGGVRLEGEPEMAMRADR